MSQYNILQAIYMSFYSKKLYRDVAMNWGGKAVFYLFVVLMLSWIMATFNVQRIINRGYDTKSDIFISQVPVVTIKDGKISTPERRPYVITDPDGKETIAIIDTTGKYTDINKTNTSLLITETEVITKPKKNEIKIYQIPSQFNQTIDPKVINGYIKNYIGFAWIFLYIIFVLASFVYRLIQAIFYSIIGKIVSLIFGSAVTFGQITQITMMALTPPIIVATLIDIFKLEYAHINLLCFVLAMVYMCFGILANKNP